MPKSTIHLFIDTNVFLSFYAYTNDDIEELRKLVSLIKAKRLRLYLTQQVSDEFRRNREGKLRESLREFEKNTASSSVPRFMDGYAAVADFRRALDQLLKAKDDAIQQAKKEADEGSLAADKLFKEIEAASGTIARTMAVSPASVWRALKQAGLLSRRKSRPSRKGTGFEQPLQPHLHWHIDVSYINLCGTFYYL